MRLAQILSMAHLALLLAWHPAAAVDEGESAPAWTLTSLDGEPVHFPDAAADRPSIVLFWSTWCPYSRALMPYLEEIRDDYAASGIDVYAINIREDGDPAEFASEAGFGFVYALEGEPVAKRYSVRFTPGLFVVDSDGTVVYRRRSTDLPPGSEIAELWAERVRAALDETLAAGNQKRRD